MDENDLQCLETGSTEGVLDLMKKFVEKHGQTFEFPQLNKGGRRSRLWTLVFKHLEQSKEFLIHKYCLTAIRFLSRDKTQLDDLMCEKWLNVLLTYAGLFSQEEALNNINNSFVNYEVVLEALKCLCNLVYNSPVAQTVCSKNHAVEGVVIRLRTYRDPDVPNEIKFFDMKLLFLITALCAEVRPRLREEFHGLTYLMETLDLILKEAGGDEERGGSCFNALVILSDDQVALACEVLKVLFNITVKNDRVSVDEEDEAHFLRLVSVLHDLLLCQVESKAKHEELQSNVVNLLTNIPSDCYKDLMTPIHGDSALHVNVEFEGWNMEAVVQMLKFLDKRLVAVENHVRSQLENLSPILTVLIECARTQRPMRKFMRSQVLPPLTDAMKLPEEGTTLRNKLCRLLTTPITQVRDLTAEFLFILCKENVGRMIKYTGYGNAAGMFANRGLLLGGPGTLSQKHEYSSDSEDSDTDEYKKIRDQVNPVTGRFELPRPNPMASMTEEQKEYEALKLVNMMDKLSRDGIIQPCRVGEDGRPEPVQHVMQLMEDLPRQQLKPPNNQSDSE